MLKGDVIVHVFGRTDVGRTREHNEDTFVVADLTTANATLEPEVRTHVSGERGTLFMVADGMGGAAAGEIASAMAVDVILEELRNRWLTAPTADPETFAMTLKMATAEANARIHQFATEHPEHRGMGTTATVAGLLGDTLYLAQVGDSRAYLIRNGLARQITKDQSLMQKLIEAGELTPEEAEQSERRNIILQALGPEARIKVDLTHQKIRRGDTLILCSDGLSGQVKADEIGRIASGEGDLMALCKRLIDRANETGGPDNITVVAARFEGTGLEDALAGDDIGHRVFPVGEDETPTIPMRKFIRRRGTTPTMSVPVAAVNDAPPAPAPPAEPRRERGRAYKFALAALALLVLAVLVWRGIRYLDRDGARATGPAAVSAPAPAPSASPPAATPSDSPAAAPQTAPPTAAPTADTAAPTADTAAAAP